MTPIHLSATCSYFLHLRPQYVRRHSSLRHPQPLLSLQCEILRLCFLILTFLDSKQEDTTFCEDEGHKRSQISVCSCFLCKCLLPKYSLDISIRTSQSGRAFWRRDMNTYLVFTVLTNVHYKGKTNKQTP